MKNINLNYGGLMGSYDIILASIMAYSAVFLLSQGQNEFGVGLVTSSASVLATLLLPWLSAKVDKGIKLNLYNVNLLIILPSFLLLILILLTKRSLLIVSILYVFAMTFQITLQPFMNAIGVLLMNRGYKLNFGFCRSMESATFALTSSVLGILIDRYGTESIILMAIFGYAVYLLLLWILYRRFLANALKDQRNEIKLGGAYDALKSSDTAFFTKYPHFKYIILGSACFFIGYNFINLFMIEVIANVGGTTQNMGFAIALGAITEMPVMILFTRINRRFSTDKLLMFSAVFFLIKAILTFAATSVMGIYLAQLTQMFSFGIYIVAAVYYTNEEMDDQDKVKGQAIVTTAHTIGGVIGSSIGGWLIQVFSVKVGLLFIILAAVMGIVSYYYGLIYSKRLRN